MDFLLPLQRQSNHVIRRKIPLYLHSRQRPAAAFQLLHSGLSPLTFSVFLFQSYVRLCFHLNACHEKYQVN